MCYAGRQLTDDYDAPIWPAAWVRDGATSTDRMTPADAAAAWRMADKLAAWGMPEWAASQSMFAATIAARVSA